MSNYASAEEPYIAAAAAYYGSIQQHVEELAIKRGFVTRNGRVSFPKLSQASGVSTATLWYLLRDKKHFRAMNMVTLAKLCYALNATPGDILSYHPGGTGGGLGYSEEAFAHLMGTNSQSRETLASRASERAG
jgi:DNA-binding Xre family transcriptional regulator